MKKILKRTVMSTILAAVLLSCLLLGCFGAVAVESEIKGMTVENTYADSLLADSSKVGGVSFFGNTEFDGCYGNQLSGLARELYDSMVKQYATDKKTGEYIHTFEEAFTFEAEVSGGSIVTNDELEEIGLEIHCAMQVALDALLYDHPEVYWLKVTSSSYSISASGNSSGGYTGIIEAIIIRPTEIYSGASAKLTQYNSAVTSALKSITVTESRYETLKNVHDYICNNAWYNLNGGNPAHSSEGFFIGDGGVVCEGYAKSFKVICDRLEIPCVLVSGDAGGAHMWNYVQMEDNKWYLVDATWDDQESKIYDIYFLADANTVGFNDVAISEERTERNDFSGTGIFTFTYPVLSKTAYTVHVHEWESDYTIDVAPTCDEKGSKSIHCRTCEATKSVTELAATNHANATWYGQQDATCTEDGYTDGNYCPDCETWLSGHELIASVGHSYGEWETVIEADCDTKGSRSRVCSVCGKTVVEGVNNAHSDADKNSECDLCGAFTSRFTPSDYEKLLKSFLFGGGNILPGKTASDSLVAWVLDMTGAFGKYYDSSTWTYTVPYADYIKIVDDNFVNHSDMKAYITQRGYWADASETVVKWRRGGLGGPNEYRLTDISYGEDGIIVVHGIAVDYGNSDEFYQSLRENYDYIYREYSYVDENGERVEGVGKAEIYGALELVLFEDGDKLRIYSFTKADYYILDGSLYYNNGDYKERYNSFILDYPDTVSVMSNGEPIENSFTLFDNNSSLWFAQGEAFVFGASPKDGCRITAVKITDENGTRELVPMSSGAYSFVPSGSTVLSIDVECEKCDYTSEIITPSSCKQQGVIVYTCKNCGEGYSEKLPIKEHSFTEQIIDSAHLVSAATTESPAIYRYDCAYCDEISEELTFTYGEKLSIPDGKPESITATQSTCEINLIWTPVDGVAGYRVYLQVGSKWKALGNVVNPTATLRNLTSGTKYTYAVQPIYRIDGKLVLSGAYSTISTATKTAKPSKLASSQSTSAIKLSWSAVQGATGYRIYFKSGGIWKVCVSTTTATSHTFKNLKAGAKYIFAVQPYIKTSSGVVWGEYAEFAAATKPAKVTAKLSSPSTGKVTLAWNAVNGADGYQVWYKTGNGSYKLYKTYSKAGTLNFTGLKSGTKYTFLVRAGIKTSGGNVYGEYKEAVITVK